VSRLVNWGRAIVVSSMSIASIAHADSWAGGARVPDSPRAPSAPSSAPSAGQQCRDACLTTSERCSAAARQPTTAGARARTNCVNIGIQCERACPTGDESTVVGATARISSATSSLDANSPSTEPPDDGSTPAADTNAPAESAGPQLAAFRQQDGERFASDQSQLMSQLTSILQVLCHGSGSASGCGSQVGQLSLPPALNGAPRASNRWPKGNVPAQAPTTTWTPPPLVGPHGPGCYVSEQFEVVGRNWLDTMAIAMVDAQFIPANGDTLYLWNHGDHDVWVGNQYPLDNVVPAHGSITIPQTHYHRPNDPNAMRIVLDAKYWSADAQKCAAQAENPGPTTPDEYGPIGGLADDYEPPSMP
jgi:hypothetical protein